MTNTRSTLTALLFAALPAAVVAQTARGSAYASALTIDSAGKSTTISMQTKILGSKFRMSIKSETAGANVEVVMILDSAARTITNVMPAAAMAMVMNTSMLSDSNSSSYQTDFASVPNVEIVDLGAGEPILGHATRHYRQSIAYVTKTTFSDQVCSNPTNDVSELWVTTDIAAPDMMTAMMQFAHMSSARSLAEKLDSLRVAKIKGTLLRRESKGTIAVGAHDTITVHMSWALTDFKADAVDSTDFEVPLGYNVIDAANVPGMDPAMFKQGMAAAQARIAEQIKKSLCRANDIQKP